MIKKAIFLFFIFINSSISAQKLHKNDLLNLEKTIYKQALQNYDLETAQVALYHIINLEGSQSTYLDSLAFVYFNQKKFLPCVRVANQILEKQEKLPILEIKAVSLENLNAIKDAIQAYEKIYKLKKDALVAYKLADLQSKLSRSAEAYTTLKSAENLKFPKGVSIIFPSEKKNETQNVPLKAAFYNLLAKTSYDLHNYDLAIKYYDQALQIYPDFYIAKQNKQVVELLKDKINSQKPNKN
jgi:tetratricopeptide (TPR) repeat protein